MIEDPRRSDRRTLWIALASLGTVVVLLLVFQRFLFLPKLLIVVLIVLAAALTGKIKPLVRDWFVFMAFVYLFDSLRGSIYVLTCKLQLPARALYVLNTEKALFGGVPSIALQKLLLRPDALGNFGWLEKVLTVCYGSHFIAFLSVGFLIWVVRPKDFPLFRTSFYFLIFVGVLIYALVPTVPPWMAADQFGLIPSLTRFNAALFNFAIPDLSNGFDTNPIAAMPSLHAGFPILCSLLLARLFRRKALPFHLYTLSILFTVVYTGDHYVTDVLAGLALAVASYLVAVRIGRRPGPAEAVGPAGGAEPDALKRRFLVGLGVLLLGVVIGGANKTQFGMRANSYGLDVPRYVDFFRDPDRYKDSYPVQAYFGRHFLARNEYRTALGYLEASLRLARTPKETQEARANIGFCRHVLGLGN